MAYDVINQLLWSRRLLSLSFNLVACLEPEKQDHYFFMQKSWPVNSTLSQKSYLYACTESSVTNFFYVKTFLGKLCPLGQSFMFHQGVPPGGWGVGVGGSKFAKG